MQSVAIPRATVVVCVCLLAIAGPRPRAQAPPDPAFEKLADLVTAKMREYRVPGVAMGVLRDGRVAMRGFGVRNVNEAQPVDAYTVFPLASISKTVTTTAVMRLVEQGKIDLRAPVVKYLPDFRVGDGTASRDVTVWHLLTHTSGWEGQLSGGDHGEETLARFVADLSTNMQLAPPGAAWSYNNAGFGVAGRIVEVITGKPFGDAVSDLVLRPLALKLAFTRIGDIVVFPFAVGHVGPPNARPEDPPGALKPFTLGSTLPAGGVAMAMSELMEYARFHMGDGTNLKGDRVLARATLAQMQTAQLRKQGYDEDMGLGWHLRTVGGIRTVAHGGTFTGHVLLLELVPEKNFAIAILTNAGSGWRLIQDIERTALREYYGGQFSSNQAIGHRGLNETLPSASALPQQPNLAAYVGRYERPMNTVDVRVESGHLVAQVRPRSRDADAAMPLVFYGPDRAFVTAGSGQNESVEFLRDGGGAVQWIRLTGRIARRIEDRP